MRSQQLANENDPMIHSVLKGQILNFLFKKSKMITTSIQFWLLQYSIFLLSTLNRANTMLWISVNLGSTHSGQLVGKQARVVNASSIYTSRHNPFGRIYVDLMELFPQSIWGDEFILLMLAFRRSADDQVLPKTETKLLAHRQQFCKILYWMREEESPNTPHKFIEKTG